MASSPSIADIKRQVAHAAFGYPLFTARDANQAGIAHGAARKFEMANLSETAGKKLPNNTKRGA